MPTSSNARRYFTPTLIALLVAATAACVTAGYRGPDRPDTGDDLFRDGAAVVRLASATDGDTARFIVGNEVYATRFLAVNTPELTHPVYGIEPWAQAAKDFVRGRLENADEIVLELDPESDTFDRYDRLLAWVWVDGELLNYRLVEEGYAWVMYLYGDYKYNDILIALEAETRAAGRRVHGEPDPGYDYERALVEHSIRTARDESLGKRVVVPGVVTARIGNNAFIQDGDAGVYVYTAQKRFKYLVPGNEVRVIGTLSDYNNLLEIVNPEEVQLVTEAGRVPQPVSLQLSEIGEQFEGRMVRVERITVAGVEPHTGRGYNVSVSQGESVGTLRIDQYLIPYIEPESFEPGQVLTVVAPVGQYQETYQLMVPDMGAITLHQD